MATKHGGNTSSGLNSHFVALVDLAYRAGGLKLENVRADIDTYLGDKTG